MLNQINFILGGDFGKVSHVIIMPLVSRFKGNRQSEVLDLEYSRINHTKDDLDFLRKLCQITKPSLEKLGTVNGCDTFVTAESNENNTNNKWYVNNESFSRLSSMIVKLNMPLFASINRNSKGLMKSHGVAVHDSNHF